MELTPTKRKKILDQYTREKTAAMKQRNRFANTWLTNEKLYSGQTSPTLITRSNLHIPKVFEAVNTMSSRIGRMPEVEFEVKDNEDENAPELMKALWDYDVKRSALDEIYRLSKTECGLYSRGIIKLIPGNDGNRFELVDTLSFLISPIANSIKTARNCGQQFIYKTIDELEQNADDYDYDKNQIKKLKEDKVAKDNLTSSNKNEDQSLRNLRLAYLGLQDTSQLGIDVVELTEWYTYFEKQAVVLTVADDKYIIRCLTLKEVGLPRFPYASYATYPRGIAFWVPAVADLYRDPNLANNVLLNQGIDNQTYRNFGMIFVDSGAGLKQSSINPRPLGITAINTNGGKIKDKVWQFTPPEISQGQNLMGVINGIADNASGLSNVNPNKRGKASVTEIATNNVVIEEKSNDFRSNVVICFEELGQLYADTIKENLTEPRKIKIYGRSPITLEGVTKKNFKDLDFIVKAYPAETANETKALQQKAATELFKDLKDDPLVTGQKYLRENLMKKYGLSEDEIGKLFEAPQGQSGMLPEQGQEGMPQQGGIPTGNPMNPAGAQLSATQSLAQSNTIRQ